MSTAADNTLNHVWGDKKDSSGLCGLHANVRTLENL